MIDRLVSITELEAAGRTPEDELDIGTVALTLAAVAKPEAHQEPYRRHLKKLSAEVAAYVGGYHGPVPLSLRHEALIQVIHKRYGYVGTDDCFDDIEAANLMRVIDQRRGLPVAIGILYLHAARHVGWSAAGVDFPGRFLLRLDAEDGRIIFDAFEGGTTLTAPDLRRALKAMEGPTAELDPIHYRKASSRDVLLRLQNNIKVRQLGARQPSAALKTLGTMVALAPDHAELWREMGMLHTRLNQIPKAIAALEECLLLGVSEPIRYQTSALLQKLRSRLH